MKKILLGILAGAGIACVIPASPLSAQELAVDWVTPIKGTGRFIVNSGAAKDPHGNIIVVGSFKDSLEVTTVTGNVKLLAGDTEDLFISKLNPGGGIEWIKQVGGNGTMGINSAIGGGSDQFVNHYFKVVTDNDGNMYISGNFKNTVDFDPGAGVVEKQTVSYLGGAFPGQTPPTLWYENGFILKLDNDGNFVWVRNLKGKANSISGIAIDAEKKSIAITGYFQDTVDFNNELGTDVLISQPPGKNVFVARYSTNGDLIWAKNMGGGGKNNVGSEAYGISMNKQGHIFTTGCFSDSSDFDPGPGYEILRSTVSPAVNVFISKLDSNGNHMWAKAVGSYTGSSAARGSAVAADNSGNVVTTGFFQGTGMFDPTNNTTIPGTPNLSMYVSKLDSTGNFVWAKSFERPGGTGTTGPDHGTGIAVDENDAVYVSGYFYGSIFLDPDGTKPSREVFTTKGSNPDPILFKLDAAGNYQWGKIVNTKANSRGYHVLVPRAQEVYWSATFGDSTTFNPSDPNNPMKDFVPVVSNANGFTMKLFCIDTSETTLTMEVCGDSAVVNGVTYFSSGTYNQSLLNSVGCDSTLIIELSLYPVIKPQIVVNEQKLSTATPYKTYQWIKNGQAINGATDPEYNVTENADYQVAVTTDHDCPDTSDVFSVTNVGISDRVLADQVKIYPNPAQDKIQINAPFEVNVQLLSVEGKLIINEKSTGSISVEQLTPGMYFIRVSNTEGQFIKTEKIRVQ